MDKIDKQILEILQENARTPLKSIAEQVFLSSPAVFVSGFFSGSLAFTVIVLVFDTDFPFEFFTEYVIVYFPAFDVFTDPEIDILLVISPSLSSFAVAPCSL